MTITVKRDGVTTTSLTPFTGRLVVRRGSGRVAVFPREGTLGIRVPGPQGPPGSSGGGAAARYVHTQAVLSSLWDVVHNLGCHPVVSVEDAGGTVVFGTVNYIDDNRLQIAFASVVTGKANCV